MTTTEPIWHITTTGQPQPLGEEGFVHASFPGQLAGTLEIHFPGVDEVVLLLLDREALGDRLVVEPSRGGELFPHVYGEILPTDVVERRAVRRADGRFDLSSVPGAAGDAP